MFWWPTLLDGWYSMTFLTCLVNVLSVQIPIQSYQFSFPNIQLFKVLNRSAAVVLVSPKVHITYPHEDLPEKYTAQK